MRGRHTRKHTDRRGRQTQKRQRGHVQQHGGSHRQLDLYTSPEAMRADMSFFLVGAHGVTTYDKKFMLVPKDTYILFTTHSGTTAPSNFPELGDMVYDPDKDTYYNRLYERIFTKGGLKFPEDYFIYEPGDLLPDYNLGFRNNGYFVSKMGVYKLPLRHLLPGAKTEYYGRTVSTIRRMLDNGILTEKDIQGLTGEMAEDIRTKTPEELQKKFYLDTFSQIVAPSIMFWSEYRKEVQAETGAEDWDIEVLDTHPPPYERLPLLDKIEQYTTYTEDNLVRDQILPSNNFNIRMSNVLTSVGAKSKKRFFVMSFCRDSYEDTINDYVRSVQPRMLRALSFSQKCGRGATSDDDTTLNLVRMVRAFCAYPIKRRAELLETAAGRKFIVLMKKIVAADWAECLSGAYESLNDSERYDLLSNYLGYLTADQLFELSALADDLGAFPELGRPLQRLSDDLQRFESVLEKTAAKKRSIIADIYEQFDRAHGVGYHRTSKGKKMVKDFLNLSASSLDLLQELEALIADPESAFMKPMTGDSSEDVEDFLKESLSEFMGRKGGRDYDPFPATEKEDESIEFRGNSNTD